MAFAIVSVTTFTVVTIRDMPWTYLNPLMALEKLLAVELKLTTNTLQAFAFITLK